MATYITKPSYYNVIGGFKPSMRESGIGAKALILDYVPGSRIVDLKLLGSTWFRLEKESIRIQVVGSYSKGNLIK